MLDKQTYTLVSGEIDKDLMWVGEADLPGYLREVVAIAEPLRGRRAAR